MTQISDLPLELVEAIIDFLHDDRGTLISCSLVCHTWLPPSRFHLFYEVEVVEQDITTDFARLVETNPAIARAIRVLRLVLPTSENWILIEPQVLISILNRLASLHTLRMWGIALGPFEADAVGPRWRHPRLRLLEFGGYMATAEQIVRTMSVFSDVEVGILRLDDLEIADKPPPDVGRVLSVIEDDLSGWKVGALFMGNNPESTTAFLFDLLRRWISPHSLTALDVVQLCNSAARNSLSSFIRERGPHLKTLRWDVTAMYLYGTESLWPSVQYCTSLESLHLYLGCDYYYDAIDSVDHVTGSFPACILPYVCPTIRVITLALGQYYAYSAFLQSWFETVNWGRLEKMLLGFKRLEELRIITEHPTPAIMCDHSVVRVPELLQMDITKVLPTLCGKLRFPDVAQNLN